MTNILSGEKALKEFNKAKKNTLSKLEQEEFEQRIQQAALNIRLSVKKCDLNTLPDFVRKSNSRLYINELNKTPEPSPTIKEESVSELENDYINQFFKDIYQVTCEDSSSFFVMQNGLGSRMVADHWTEESIDKCAELAAKLGGKCHMIPSGEPGAFPDHLRKYASQAFAKQGIHFPDPTPPTVDAEARSKQKYGLFSTQSAIKENMTAMRTEGQGRISSASNESSNNQAIEPPISTRPKPY